MTDTVTMPRACLQHVADALERCKAEIDEALTFPSSPPPPSESCPGEGRGLREALEATKHWASSQCPCDETKDPCPLCGATIFDGSCKAVEAIFPKKLLAQIDAALASPSEPAPANAVDDWVKVDESHSLPGDLKPGDEVIGVVTMAYGPHYPRPIAYRRRPSAEQGG